MSKDVTPAFQFYPRDWLSSESVRVMSSAARGIYITLMGVCWLEGSLPDDDAQLCKLADALPEEWEREQSVVRARFFEKNGRLFHRRLDRERVKQRAHRRLQSEKGKKSVEARLKSGSTSVDTPVQPNVNSASAFASALVRTPLPPLQGGISRRTRKAAKMGGPHYTDSWCEHDPRCASPDVHALVLAREAGCAHAD